MNRLNALRNMISLCSRREAPRQISESIHEETSHESPDIFSMSCPGTQCLFCLGTASLCDLARVFCFSRRDALQRHVLEHLRTRDWSQNSECPHPVCEAELESDMHFKNHALIVHNIRL
jgi:hypothetical protein